MEAKLLAWPPHSEDGAARFLARRFGSAPADLDVEFGVKPRSAVTTALLSCCVRDVHGQRLATDTLWEWSVAARTQGLLAVARTTFGPHTPAVTTCNAAGCGERIELELVLADFAASTQEAIDWQTPQQQWARVRLPTGADQRAWFRHEFEQPGADDAWLARRLVTHLDSTPPDADWVLPPVWLTALGDALAAADPLTALTVTANCPACDADLEVEVDLEWLLLDACRREQHALLDDVHQLAAAYGWSETEIVALPSWRRARYLSRIQAH